jgi:chromosome segregation ATPase
LEEKYTKLLNDVDNLGDINQQLKELNNDKEILTTRNTALRMVVDQLKLEREELTDKLNIALHDSTEAKTQMEVTELNMSTLKFTLSTTEEQLNDAQTLIEDNKVLMKSYEEEKQNAVSELSQMKIEFDEINHKYKLEMEAKKSLEDQTVQLKNKLDEIVGSNLMELQELREQLDDQGQMTDEYRDKVNKLEMNQVMLEHQLVELKQQYNVEHSLNGNLYNEIYQLRQEHGKLQAAHQKLIKQYQNKDIEIEEILNEKEQVMQDKAIIEEALDFERTKLRIQTAQFTKLVDYNTTTSNNSCSGGGSNERKHKMVD